MTSGQRKLRARLIAIPMLALLPLVVLYLWDCLSFHGGALAVPTWQMVQRIPAPTAASVLMFGGWFLYHVLMQVYAPGRWHEGTELKDGTRLRYKMNGWFTWWFTWAGLGAGVGLGLVPATILADQFGPLMTTGTLFAYAFCVWLYIHGKRHADDGSEEQSGDIFYDYFMGTSLNPRTSRFDWKLFCEARPGLIGWVALDLSLAAKQQELHGSVTTPMILVCAFQFWYIADYYFHEEAILTTWDIKHENFGFMLCFGDLVWVPFTYSIQAYYLVAHTHDLSFPATAGIVVLNIAGYAIFRGANLQKHHFRKDPTRPVWGRPAESIKTTRGTLLLTSGFWGIARHMNYLGDLMMGLAWCLTCGFGSPLPYFYIIYFTILLVHRERRDDALCSARYGADWEAYRQKARWRILPGVY
jgi:Delta14-sterol reductase